MNTLVLRATGRHLLRHPWQLGLAILGIALGIAVVCAVQLTQASARQALAYAQRSLSGPASHRIEATGTLEAGIDEQAYAALVRQFPRLALAPLLSGRVSLARAPERSLQVIGIDVLGADAGVLAARRLGQDFDVVDFVGRPGHALLNASTAARLGLAEGARLDLLANGAARSVVIQAIAPAARDGGPADDMLVMDIASAQEILDRAGRLSAIEVMLDTTLSARQRALRAGALRDSLPPGLRLVANDTRLGAARDMTHAFDVNLTALSLLALLVGLFLIYNTVSFLALQRRHLFERLRALGVLERELFGALLVETCVIAVVGITLGLVLGRAVAGVLLQFVARTVNDLYYRAAITTVTTPGALLFAIAVLGFLATLAAALPPILAVTRETASGRARRTHTQPARVSLALMLIAWCIGGVLLAWPTRALWPGFGALFAFLIGAALPLPWLLAVVARRLASTPRLSTSALVAWRALAAHGQRAGLAAAALMVACATSLAVTVMVLSFRLAVTDWLQALLRADVYVDVGRERSGPDDRPLAALRARIALLPEVAATSAVIRSRGYLHEVTAPVSLLAYDLPPAARAGFHFLAGDAAAVWAAWDTQDVALVTEAFAWRHRLHVGEDIVLDTPGGAQAFRVLGLYRDYASERGSVALSRARWQHHFPPQDDSGVGVYAAAGVDADTLERALRQAFGDVAGLHLQSNSKLRELSLEIFDQTFAVTNLLRLLALGVAVVGIVSALLAQQLERMADYALLRALGMARGELLRVVLYQTCLVGVLAATLAMPVGLALAVLLIDVINVRSFGWTMNLELPWLAFLSMWLSALAAALVAGLYPAVAVTRQTPATVLRND